MMLQAEIYSKDTSEDRLTGEFFGALRYLPFDIGMKEILNKVYPENVVYPLANVTLSDWSDRIHFWQRETEGIPDIVIELDSAVVLIEVKLDSGLSSNDEIDNSEYFDANQFEQSNQQLAKYARILDRIANGRDKILILLAPQDSAHIIWTKTRWTDKEHSKQRDIIGRDVNFGYITWQAVLDALLNIRSNINADNPFQEVIISDLIAFLECKGFYGFRGFSFPLPTVDINEIWFFDSPSNTADFSFYVTQKIKEGNYYVFGK